MNESNFNKATAMSFGTPQKQDQKHETFISPIAGDSILYVKSPDEGKIYPDQTLKKANLSASTLYSNYPWKSPNERLIDMKNATWNTKNAMKVHGTMVKGKLLYAVGPREAYVVDKTFDRDMNFLELGELSHDGEMIFQK